MPDCSTVTSLLRFAVPCRSGLYMRLHNAFTKNATPPTGTPCQSRSGIRQYHACGASCIAWIIFPIVAASSRGLTIGRRSASTAAVASSHAPAGSLSRENCFAHADSRRWAA